MKHEKYHEIYSDKHVVNVDEVEKILTTILVKRVIAMVIVIGIIIAIHVFIK